ncbi:ATPase [Pseudomonas sp. NCCP-436]|uniref:ATPase n=1 Tax=Pseudomonas sp. NCCP-436 TaxID=2842481 RepID=UPI001C7F261B|nr:ATPase [Pseudomonas sp. NCCP-436]GIZ11100.1 ATPase [Pseudomonas sp. NCCP-436]
MRNDAHDELDHLPSLTPERREELAEPHNLRAAPGKVATSGSSTGPLWALVGALSIALGGLGWWSLQQIGLMEQRLVATQESFARISEEAAGRIQDISGKVVATESSVTSGTEALKLAVDKLDARLSDLVRQQQQDANTQAALDKRLEQLAGELKSGQGASAELERRLQLLIGEQAELKKLPEAIKALRDEIKTSREALAQTDSRLKSLGGDVEAMKKLGDPSQAIRSLEQDLLVLRSEIENRPQPSAGPNTAEFDAFRAQMTRNINTLQSQVMNLQQQLDAR